MPEPVDLQENNRQKNLLFQEWSLYNPEIINPQLPPNIRYTPPQVDNSLRDRIKVVKEQLTNDDITYLRICLSFLEKGMLEDNFNDNEDKRHECLLKTKIEINGQSITLYELSKKVNKLSGNAIAKIITAGQLFGLSVNNQTIYEQAVSLMEEVENIQKTRGYFLRSDLEKIDKLARLIIDHVLTKYET